MTTPRFTPKDFQFVTLQGCTHWELSNFCNKWLEARLNMGFVYWSPSMKTWANSIYIGDETHSGIIFCKEEIKPKECEHKTCNLVYMTCDSCGVELRCKWVKA